MKTVYDKNYKGYRVEVFAEFKEGTKVERPIDKSVPSAIYDSVRFEARYHTEYRYSPPVYRKIERKRENRKEIYEKFAEELNEVVDILEKKIDRLVREREVTEGLPESLLKDSDSKLEQKASLHDGETVIPSQRIIYNIPDSKNASVTVNNVAGIVNEKWKALVREMEDSSKENHNNSSDEETQKQVINVNVELTAGSAIREAHRIAKEIADSLGKIKFQ
ncbi:hypothetical protein ABE073_04980 [Lederbergia citrisecunda]|uniref:hypothetical protein n=1 Tax=Lederbergia citrisecunda TaxID=2833583 RepID=UPI003D2956E9